MIFWIADLDWPGLYWCTLALFFFDVLSPDELVLKDADGIDLADLEAAIAVARSRAEDFQRYATFGGRPVPGWSIEIKDAAGHSLFAAPILARAAAPLSREDA